MFTKRFVVMFFLLLGALALVACGAPTVEPGAPAESATETPEAQQAAAEALPAARAALADFLGIDEEALELDKIEDMEWSDSCLGLGGPAESCLAAITPGYAITFIVDGEPYIVRTDLEGNAVRVEAAYPAEGPGAPEGAEPEAVVQAALERIAQETGLAVDEIEMVSFEAMEWSDSCLGLGGPAESCLAAITPGYLIVLRAGEQEFNVRTDATGAAVRIEELAGMGDERPGTVEVALQTLAAELGAAVEDIEVVSFEQVEWTDGCLGLGGPAESCLQAITPGWRIMLNFDGQVYEVRTDESGSAVRIAGPQTDRPSGEAPDLEMGDAVLFYQRSGGIAGELVTVRVYADGTVERTGGPNQPTEQAEQGSVTPEAVEQLLAELEEIGYFELERDYVPEDQCCDLFLHLMSVRRGEEVHTVEALEGTADKETAPEAVWESVAIIESFVEGAISMES